MNTLKIVCWYNTIIRLLVILMFIKKKINFNKLKNNWQHKAICIFGRSIFYCYQLFLGLIILIFCWKLTSKNTITA